MKVHIKETASSDFAASHPMMKFFNSGRSVYEKFQQLQGKWWRVDTSLLSDSSFNIIDLDGKPLNIKLDYIDAISFEEMGSIENYRICAIKKNYKLDPAFEAMENIARNPQATPPPYFSVTRASHANVNNLILVTKHTDYLNAHLIDIYKFYRHIKQPVSPGRIAHLMSMTVDHLRKTLYDDSLTGEDLDDYREKTTISDVQRDEYVRILIEDFSTWNEQQDYEATLNVNQ